MGKYWKAVVVLAVFVFFVCCSNRQNYVGSANEPSMTRPDAININRASVDELETLPHIGRKTAENIVRFREENGPFRRIEHLMQIRGVSESRFAELRPYLKTE